MKNYIQFNTEKSTNAVDRFQKKFFKLMIDRVYGKKWEIYGKESMSDQ